MNNTNQFGIEEAEALLRDIVAGIVFQPRSIEVETVPFGSTGQRMIFRVDASETPKLVGKGAKHIKAVQTLFTAIGEASGLNLRVTLDEGKASAQDYRSRVKNDFSPETVKDLLQRIVEPMDSQSVVRSNIRGSCSLLEVSPARFTSEVGEAIKTLFSAIGRSYGRVVECEFL